MIDFRNSNPKSQKISLSRDREMERYASVRIVVTLIKEN